MAAFFDSLVLLVLPENCYQEFFLKFNFFHGPCWKVLISRVLGYGIVAGSTLVKLPQMLKIFMAGSVEGLSLVSFLLELLSVTISMTYNIANRYPFR
jgi:mannose-P-dolichol utilization defect protein 1